MDSRVGAQSHLRHGGVAARLVHLAPAPMGRAAAGLLRGAPKADHTRRAGRPRAAPPAWCTSRRRSGGVPLPVFYAADGKPIIQAALARKVADIVETQGT